MITRRQSLAMLAAPSLLALSGCSQGNARSNWQFFKGNPVIGGEYGTCFDPYVLLDNGKFRMWFSWRPQHSIAYCESHDGVSWSAPQVVLGLDPEQNGQTEVNRCTVIQRDGVYHMWFTGQTQTTSSIYYATSPDGLKWTRTQSTPVLWPSEPWEKTSVMCPDIIIDEQTGLWRMYYSAGEQYEPDGIGLATSADGKTWQKHPTPIFTSAAEHPWEKAKVTACNVHYVDGWYYMFYIGFADTNHAAICLARSRNGIDQWERHPSNPILQAPSGLLNFFEWDRDAIYKPAAVLTDKGWVMFFNARRRHTEQIGMATHEGQSLGFPAES
ncbi:family 43 glycosylhydrolase [Acetobacter suratthaniensis]|uniref:Family 43 glycosylhydrolase n=1 Tax=Acetobacter suratthaniensis TaxID=1502841 RepID=A0ABS3LJF1_9PROT|nr:family 43 glycosylhydrolase [Acetobacter suratthaniensis]MCX2565269.1 family 43 glycosylhydrolase [Acetobacter suratthaniensis]